MLARYVPTNPWAQHAARTRAILAALPAQVDAIRRERETRVVEIAKSCAYLAMCERETELRQRIKARDDDYKQIMAELIECRLKMREMIER